jgi:hypothetical protein
MSVTDATPYSQSYDGRCYQLLAELSDQFGGKILPLRKKLDPQVVFAVLCLKGICAFEEKKTIFVYVNERTETYNIS